MFRTIAVAALTMYAAATTALAKCPPPALETYQGAMDSKGWFHIPLIINGQTVQGVVCTNCWVSELGEKFADRAAIKKIPRTEEGYALDYDGNRTEYYTAPLQIRFGNIPFKRSRQFIISGEGDTAAIGLDLLSYFDVEFNPAERSLTLHGTNECGRPQAAWAQQAIEMPFKTRHGLIYVVTTMNGKPVEARLSTGSPVSMMGFATAKLHFGLTPQSPGVRKTGTMGFAGSDKSHDLYEYRLPEMVLGGLVFRDVPLKLVDVDDFGFALGLHELNQLRLYIQFGGSDIYAVRADGR